MSGIRIEAGTTSVGTTGSSATAASGSPAQQAYDRAVKQLAAAQKKLSQDVFDKAPEATIKVDQAAVEAAALSVAAATAALAREQAKAQEGQTSRTAALAPAQQAETPSRDRSRTGDVDLYA